MANSFGAPNSLSWSRQPVVTVVTPPAVEPLSVAEAKVYLRVDTTADDGLIGVLIAAARQWVETFTRRALITQTLDQAFASFMGLDNPLYLARAPLQSVTSITYLDQVGDTQTLDPSNYRVRAVSGPTAGRGWIELTSTTTLPRVYPRAEAPVTVRTVSGYGNAATDVPAGLKAAIYLLLGDLYEQRQETILGVSSRTKTTVERLLAPYRLPEAQ